MATSLEPQTTPQSSQQYVDFDEYIDFQLQKTRASIRTVDILTAVAGTVTLVLAYLLVFVALDHWVIPGGFGNTARMLMLGGLGVVSVAWLAWKVAVPYLRSVNGLFAASVIERSAPEMHSTLLNLVDLRRAGRPIPENIRNVLEKRAAWGLAHTDVDHAVDRRPLMRISYALLAIVVLCCLYAVFSPKKISSSVMRAVLPTADVAVSTRTEILEVRPGDAEVLARTQLQVVAELRGELPDRVTLFYTTADRKFVDEPIEMREIEQGVKRYRGIITGEGGSGIRQNLTYHVAAGDARTRDFQVTVTQPPSARIDEVRYEYPGYMELSPRTRSGGHIDAWEGTKVTVTATANMPVQSAVLVFSDDEDTSRRAEDVRMEVVDGTRLQAEWTLNFRSDGTHPRFYRIQCRNEKGQTDPQPTLYNIVVRPDQRPEVTLLDPQDDLERPANAIVPLMIQAHDPDFKLRFVHLRIEKEGEPLGDEEIFDGLRQSLSTTYQFELEKLDLQPGDTITYWIEARDNKEPEGNRRNTPKLNIHIVEPVSEEDVEKQREHDQQRQEDQRDETEAASDEDGMEEGMPQQEPQDPGEEGTEGEAEQPGGETQPDDTGRGETPGEMEDDQGDEGDAAGQEPSDETEGDGSGRQKFDPDGADDDRVLEELIRRQQEQQDEQTPADQSDTQEGDDTAGDQQPQDDGRTPDQADSESPSGGEGDREEMDRSDGDDAGRDPQDGMAEEGMAGEDEGDGEAGAGSDKGPDGGAPSDTDQQASDKQSGMGDEEPKSDQPDRDEKPEGEMLTGEEEPAEDSEDAVEREATGREEGTGTPDHDPDSDPAQAENDIQRKEGEEPATREREGEHEPGSRGEEDAPSDGDPSTGQPEDARDDSGTADRPSMPEEGEPEESDARRPSEAEEGEPGEQRSDDPSTGRPGDPTDDHAGDDSAPHPEEAAGDPEDTTEGADQRPDRQDDPSPSEGDPRPNDTETEGAEREGPAEGHPDQQSDQEGQEEGDGGSGTQERPEDDRPAGRARGGEQDHPTGEGEAGDAGEAPPAEEANLDYAKEAANLTLKRLQDQIQRGEVDQDLLDELGWTEQDMERFADRLGNQLHDGGGDQSPEAQARRRQFEEVLRNLDLQSGGTRRSGSDVKRHSPDGSFGPQRLPVPDEYRELYDAYTRELSRQTGREDE